ncbi:MAG: P1 family peptidase, partial [Anaerotruncus colihominis]
MCGLSRRAGKQPPALRQLRRGDWRHRRQARRNGDHDEGRAGLFAVQAGDLQVGAAVVVNALGDNFDPDTHERIAGMRTPDGKGFADSTAVLCRDISDKGIFFTGNTTIAAIVTNAAFDKTQLTKIASMAQNGLARAIDPVHTTADGDSVY